MIEEGAPLWEPSAEVVERARTTRYMQWLWERGVLAETYDELWRWSVTEIDAFWDSLWEFFDVRGARGAGPVRSGAGMPGVEWFPGATLNYAANALRPEHSERLAVIARSEAGDERRLTYGELAAELESVRRALHRLGVRQGDRVAAYLPNTPDALVFFLATASLGAVWSCCSPDFGAPSVIDRFAQIEPTVLVAVESYAYNGKTFSRAAELGEIVAALPTLRATVVVAGDPGAVPGALPYTDFLAVEGDDPAPEFAAVPFGHPLWIVYSSGTTGLPKPIVHGHGGVVLEHLKALSFHQDLGADDVFLWFTTTGWMMWNYLVGGLLLGATVVMYDGAPAGDTLWRVAAETGTTYLGLGAPYIMASRKAGLRPGAEFDLSRLRGIGSTGSPLPPEGFAWVYEAVGSDLLLGSLSGGTDVCTGFVGPSTLLPLRAGVIQCRSLGAAVDAFDDAGASLVDEVGELVLTEPMPSMPVFFWNDPDGERYRESYFDTYPGVWRHGDWIKILPDGGCVIYGRSDSTLNRGGVRMGTSDFYRVVEAFDEISDSLVIDTGRLGQEGRLLLYVQLAPGAELDDDLLGRLKTALRSSLSPRHVPDEIIAVSGVPRTLSGKKLEIPVRKILLGTPVTEAANPDSLANPEVLKAFRPLD